MRILKRRYLFVLYILCIIEISLAQEKNAGLNARLRDTFNIQQSSFLLPQVQQKWKFYHAISLYFVVPPKDWILDRVNTPFINYSCKYTLPKAFNFQLSLSTIFVSNRFVFGPYWNYQIKKFHFSLAYQLAYNRGRLESFGYNTLFTSWEQQPSVTWAYNFGKTALIVRGDLFYTTSIKLVEGGNTISNNDNFTNGYAVTMTIDQRLHKNKVMSLGFKLSYLRYHIIAWPALPVNQYSYVIPEFQIGYNF